MIFKTFCHSWLQISRAPMVDACVLVLMGAQTHHITLTTMQLPMC